MNKKVLVKQQQIYIHQLCIDSGCYQQDLTKAMTNRDGCQDSVKGIHAVSMPDDDDISC